MFRHFQDRAEAGRALAHALSRFLGHDDAVVVALPRGGVPVGFEIARALGLPLDVCIVRKLGVPGHEELAFGAIAEGGAYVINEGVVVQLRIPAETIEEVTANELTELERRASLYGTGRARIDVRGNTVILADDGLATGATMRAAVKAMKNRGAKFVLVAIPVAPCDTCRLLAQEADDVLCLVEPECFDSVGSWYDHFPQVTDDEVRRLLQRAPWTAVDESDRTTPARPERQSMPST